MVCAFDRESVLPLTVGIAVGLLLYVVILPSRARTWLTSSDLAAKNEPAEVMKTPNPLPSKLNRLHPKAPRKPHTAQVARIAYDHYQQLLAPKARTAQPALQQTVRPVPHAPHRMDTAPPHLAGPQPTPTHHPQLAAEKLSMQDKLDPPEPAPQQKQPHRVQATVALRHRSLLPKLNPLRNATLPPALDRAVSMPTPKRAKAADRRKEMSAQIKRAPNRPPHVATTLSRLGRPTASLRSDREAPPATITADSKTVRTGSIITGKGLLIKTVAPRISPVTFLTALRGGLSVPLRVVFGKRGRVTSTRLKRHIGYPEADIPIRASLYQWRASEKRLAQRNGPFEIKINLAIRIRQY